MLYTVLALLGLFVAAECGPFHASCKIDWNFGIPCTDVKTKILDQIKAWQGLDHCGTTQKCGYSLTSQTDTEIKGKHMTTDKHHYLDDLTFTLTPDSNGCKVHGFSTSETWYAILDLGVNYCNLHNLITGSGLHNTAGYKETTSSSICTEYNNHNCDKY